MMKLLEDRRANAPRAYRTEGATHQWVERRYLDHTLPPSNLIKVSQFWLDYARHDPASGPFTSPHLLEAAHNDLADNLNREVVVEAIKVHFVGFDCGDGFFDVHVFSLSFAAASVRPVCTQYYPRKTVGQPLDQ